MHILNAAIDGRQPDDIIDKTTLDSAIAINKFYLSQVRLIHSEGDGEDGNSLAPLYRKILDLVERKGSINAREVKRSSRQFKDHKPDDIRSLFTELDQIGKAKTSGSGTKLVLSTLSTPVDGLSTPPVDKDKSSVNGGSSHSEKKVDANPDVSNTDTQTTGDKTENNPESPPLDRDFQDKNKTVDGYDNINVDPSTPLTDLSVKQSQQGLEVVDTPSTKATTPVDKTKNDDKTIPVNFGDIVIHRAWDGQIITSTVERIEIKELLVAPLSTDKKIIQNIYLDNGTYTPSDSDDLIKIQDQWGKVKWEKTE